MVRRKMSILVAAVCLLASATATLRAASKEVSYNRDIRPVLSDNCFLCHGPDANTRKAKLRLDIRESALEKEAFVPGKPDESELIKRILTTDEDDLMPPPDSHKKLTPQQKELFRDWIAQGAKYENHWAYIPPTKAAVPSGRNAVDHLVQERLKTIGLKPSPEADRRTLARRLYFDLLGLPPKPDEVEAFENDTSPLAYSNLVEKLLNSPHYGERMAIGWLDVVRFADTIGYHSDNPRNVWPYRDYVIKAFNENKPFDKFTVEQLAGDLLPGSGLEQKVGSAFNRLLLSTEEGGAQPKDYEYRMLTDRVRAVGSVWLGQTLGCAACHDHKFDPISSRDFYSMGAFFADIKEPILGRREDGILVPDKKQEAELARLDSELNRLQKEYDSDHPELKEPFAKWEQAQLAALEGNKAWSVLTPSEVKSAHGAKLKVQPEGSVLGSEQNPDKDTYTITIAKVPATIVGLRLEVLPHDSLPSKGPGRAGNGNFVLTELVAKVNRASGEETKLSFKSARATIEQTFAAEKNRRKTWAAAATIDGDIEKEGWAILPEAGRPQQLLLELTEAASIAEGDSLVVQLYQNHGHSSHTIGHFRLASTDKTDAVSGPFALPPQKETAELLSIPAEKRDDGQKQKLFGHFKSIAPELADLRKDLAAARKAKTDFEATVGKCIVSISTHERRTVRILPRGNFLQEDKGETVEPALPAYLPGAKASSPDKRLTRLDLATWVVSRENPLTARVTVNRFWKQFFGTGLSRVLDDVGAQGEPPPNQALLDWLACEFMDSGWDVKHLVRLIVNSHTYKQVSTQSPELRAKDPYNRELASQSRWRLDAELVRDNALFISGLLVPKIGGPSVRPYQPDGYWENLNFPPRNYDASPGQDQYRRGLYTWWQRSFVHPSMLAFDAPTREECAAERNRSNIPQQALVLLNDPSYVEASRLFATRILHEGGSGTSARLNWAWKQALSRTPDSEEMKTVTTLLEKHLAQYQADKSAAESFLKVGQQPVSSNLDPAELAAWTNVARVIMNLHETITRS